MYSKTKYNLGELLRSFAGEEKNTPSALAGNLRSAGVLVRENVLLHARHGEALVGEYVCPLLVNERTGIFFNDNICDEELMRARLRNLRETLGLSDAIMILKTGDVCAADTGEIA